MKSFDLLEKLEELQHIFIARATHGEYDDEEYRTLRTELIENSQLADRLPRFVRTSKNLSFGRTSSEFPRTTKSGVSIYGPRSRL